MNETLLTVCLEKINYYVEKYLTDGAEQQIEVYILIENTS